jgi:hypothetical protein
MLQGVSYKFCDCTIEFTSYRFANKERRDTEWNEVILNETKWYRLKRRDTDWSDAILTETKRYRLKRRDSDWNEAILKRNDTDWNDAILTETTRYRLNRRDTDWNEAIPIETKPYWMKRDTDWKEAIMTEILRNNVTQQSQPLSTPLWTNSTSQSYCLWKSAAFGTPAIWTMFPRKACVDVHVYTHTYSHMYVCTFINSMFSPTEGSSRNDTAHWT